MNDYRQALYASYRRTQYGLGNREGFTHRTFKAYRAEIGKMLPVDKDARILDLGCGSGFLLEFLKRSGYRNIQGVDISPEQVEFARQAGLPVVLDDAGHYLGENKGFDAIVLTDVIEHVKKDELLSLLAVIRNALAPGGRLIVRTPNASSVLGAYGRYIDFTHETAFTEQSLRQVLLSGGFDRIEMCDSHVPFGLKPQTLARWFVLKTWRSLLKLIYLAELGTTRPRLLGGNLIASAVKADVEDR